jgi:hypothetical protein
MPEQIFRYESSGWGDHVLIPANHECGARELLRRYISAHVMMPSIREWRLKEVCGKVSDTVFIMKAA